MNIQTVKAAYGSLPYDATARSAKKVAPEKSAAAQEEQVEISEASLNLQTVQEAVDAIPDVRIELVEQIKSKIKLNGYPLESSLYKAVEKLVSDHII